MPIKFDMLFHASTNLNGSSPDPVRTGGWSEGWYSQLGIDQVKVNGDFLCRARASLLPKNVSIIGQRYRIVGGGSSTAGKQYQGTQNIHGDLPTMSVLMTCKGSGVPNVRRFAIRGLADARVDEGEFVPAEAFTAGLKWFGDLLAKDGWRFKGRVLTNVKGKIDSITTGGVVVMQDAVTLAAGNLVRFLNVVDAQGVNQSGVYLVTAAADSTHFTVSGYTGAVAERGFARKEQSDYFSVEEGSLIRGRVITHKIGRSFFQFRGRASKRK